MNTAEPIRDEEELEHFKNFYLREEENARNQTLIMLGLNTALRVSDILQLRWKDVYDFQRGRFRTHITLSEQKTGKKSSIFMNEGVSQCLIAYMEGGAKAEPDGFLLAGRAGNPLTRVQAWRIVTHAAEKCGISGVISPHSLRKTFGYQAWKKGVDPSMLMHIFNHSSYEITKRYLGIQQDDRDEVFRKVCF